MAGSASAVRVRVRRTSLLAAVLVASAPTLLAPPLLARAGPTLIGSTDDGTLVVFAADRPQAIRTVRATGLSGRLIGVDTRPADGQNLRINVTLGATAADSPLAYAPGDRNAGKRPRIAAAAYTNAVASAPTTRLFEIDAEQDVLVVQDPPNDGILATVGPLGVDFAPLSGLAIVTDAAGVDHAYAATGGKLYTVDLATGHADPVGPIGDPPTTLVFLAATTEAPAPCLG